jgi:hypothetical protein
MRKGILVDVTAADRAHLEAVVAKPQQPAKACLATKTILLTADGLSTNATIRGTGSQQICGLALAGAVHAGGRGRVAARQNPRTEPRAA